MVEVESIYKVIKTLEKYKDTKEDEELLNDIYIVDSMIKRERSYDEKVINDIIQKYSLEFNYLENLERNLRGFQQNSETSSNKSIYQYLLNIRHSLVRVGVMRILKRKGKEMLEDVLINKDNDILNSSFEKIMEQN